MPASCFSNQHRSDNCSSPSCSSSVGENHHPSTLTTPDERAQLVQRFTREGIDATIPDAKKLPYVWQWLNDAECNCLSLRKQIEKLHRQQEIDLLEVENYVNHVWRASSDKIKSLEKECNSLQSQLNCHRANGCLYNCTDIASNFVHESLGERATGIRSFFRRKSKSNDKMSTVHRASNKKSATLKGSTNKTIDEKIEEDDEDEDQHHQHQQQQADDKNDEDTGTTHTTYQRPQCNVEHCNCVEVVDESEAIVKKLQATVRDLEVENVNLTSKLSQLLRVCTLLRSKLREKHKQSLEEKTQNTTVSTSLYLPRAVDSSEIDRRLKYEEKACQTSTSYTNSYSNSLISNSGEKNTLNSNDTGIFSNVSSAIEANVSASTTMANEFSREDASVREKDEMIHRLRDQIRRLEKQVTSKDASYADLVKKYEMRKQLHADTVSRLREYIERENRKWQQLFQAANLRKRQALAQLGHHRNSALPSSQMDIG